MNSRLSHKGLSATASESMSYLILFVIWPFLAFVIALANYYKKEARMIVYLFLVYFGLTFVAEQIYMDAVRYIASFVHNATLPNSDFFKIVGGFYNTDNYVDILEPLISFLVSRITDDYHFLFAAYAVIFAFFYLRSINLLYDRYRENPNRNAGLYLLFFTLLIPVTNINVVRMWVAAWIFFYGAYLVLSTHKAKYLLITLGACLMHWSFVSVNIILLAYFFAGNRNRIYTPIAIVSFIVPNIVFPLFDFTSRFLGGAVATRFSNYTSESYTQVVQQASEQASWFLNLNGNLIYYYFIVAILTIRIFRRKYMRGKTEENLYSFLLLLFSMVNFGRSLPAFGARFQTVFILFATAYLFLYFMNLSKDKFRLITIIGIVPMLLNTLIEFRVGSENISPWILTPGLGLPLLDPTLSIAQILFY
jgi:hypothetical protein